MHSTLSYIAPLDKLQGHNACQFYTKNIKSQSLSAWVPISDLAAWWRFHGDKNKYGIYLMAVCGGRPGDSAEVDRQYYERSPINFLDRAVGLPLDIAAGVHDGHSGPVPVRHTLEAFNVLAKAQGKPAISEEEIRQISRPKGRLITMTRLKG